MDLKKERNCSSEQEVEKKIHVNERPGKLLKGTQEKAEQTDKNKELK